jgi:hypothetical protein
LQTQFLVRTQRNYQLHHWFHGWMDEKEASQASYLSRVPNPLEVAPLEVVVWGTPDLKFVLRVLTTPMDKAQLSERKTTYVDYAFERVVATDKYRFVGQKEEFLTISALMASKTAGKTPIAVRSPVALVLNEELRQADVYEAIVHRMSSPGFVKGTTAAWRCIPSLKDADFTVRDVHFGSLSS